MSDSKITQLPAVTTLADTDLFTAVTDPGGTPANKKITIGDVRPLMVTPPSNPLTLTGLSGAEAYITIATEGRRNILFTNEAQTVVTVSMRGEASGDFFIETLNSYPITVSASGGLSLNSENQNITLQPYKTSAPDSVYKFNENGMILASNVSTGLRFTDSSYTDRSSILSSPSEFTIDSAATPMVFRTTNYATGKLVFDGIALNQFADGAYPIRAYSYDGTINYFTMSVGQSGNDMSMGTDTIRPMDYWVSGKTLADWGAAWSTEVNFPLNDPSAVFDISSTIRGVLWPRMSTVQRDAIVSPAVGLQIYNLDTLKYESYNGSGWVGGGTTSPAGSDTQIQYNSGGTAFGASTSLTFDNSAKVLTVTGTSASDGSITLSTVSNDNATGGNLTLTTGGVTTFGTPHVQTGGNIYLTTEGLSGTSGNPTNTSQGGSVYLTTPESMGNNTQLRGGDVILTTGVSYNYGGEELSGGDIILQTGTANGGTVVTGGSITLRTGAPANGSGGQTLTGGNITLTTGSQIESSSANMVGGSLTLTTGDCGIGGTDVGGNISLTSFTPANGGNLTLSGTDAGRGQVGVGTLSPDASASVDITSTTRGFLPPRMTSGERDAIVSPVLGLQIFNTDTFSLESYNGSQWQGLGLAGGWFELRHGTETHLIFRSDTASYIAQNADDNITTRVIMYMEDTDGGAFRFTGGSNTMMVRTTTPSVSITNNDDLTVNASALLQLNTTTRGFLPPRMTSAERDAIGTPADGLMIYQTDNTPGIYARVSGSWTQL